MVPCHFQLPSTVIPSKLTHYKHYYLRNDHHPQRRSEAQAPAVEQRSMPHYTTTATANTYTQPQPLQSTVHGYNNSSRRSDVPSGDVFNDVAAGDLVPGPHDSIQTLQMYVDARHTIQTQYIRGGVRHRWQRSATVTVKDTLAELRRQCFHDVCRSGNGVSSDHQAQSAATVRVVRYPNAALQRCSRQHASCSDAYVLDQWEALVLWNANKAEMILQQVNQKLRYHYTRNACMNIQSKCYHLLY
jgi:hypothetical protein